MIILILLVAMILAGLWSVMARSLLKGTIGLAVTSVIITMIMFQLDSPLAAVFELSVCAGLITVIFMSTISLTKVLTHQEIMEISKNRLKRYWPLPVIVIFVGIILAIINLNFNFTIHNDLPEKSVQEVLWNLRQLDLFGQIIILLAGVFGIVILFKERGKDE